MLKVGEVREPGLAANGKPLDGVRVLALEQMQALPYATQLLAHLGADVVKVERPGVGESGRMSHPSVVDTDGRTVGATYIRNNLSKRSMTVDWKRPEGRDLLLRLASGFDVFAENFRSGRLARLGLGPEHVAAAAPRTVYLSLSGFGHRAASPYLDWPAYAPIAEAMAGFYEESRVGEEPPRILPSGALGDIGTALFAVIGTLAALRHRDHIGRGQHVDVAMYDSMIAMADMIPFAASMGVESLQHGAAAYGVSNGFRARDGWFVLAAFRPAQLEKLADTVGHPEWKTEPRLADIRDWRTELETIVRPGIEGWASTKTKLEAARALAEGGIPAGPCNVAEDLRQDAHVALRDMIVELPRSDGGDPIHVVGSPVKLSDVAEGPVRRFPRLGEHTDEVLADLGVSEEERERLRGEGVI